MAATPAPWAAGSSRPTTTPTGKVWDEGQANFIDDPSYQDPWATDQFKNIDPRLKALYQKHNIAPQGAGTGFTDAQYWHDKMQEDPNYDFLTRLDKDLSGTGTDRSTGTIWGADGAPAGVDSMADNSGYSRTGAQLAGLAPGGGGGQLDILSQGQGPGSYAWRQAQIYALQQRLINGGSK